MKKLIEYGLDDHPDDDEDDKAPAAWSVVIMDDCPACGDLRVELTVEDVGQPGSGHIAHLSPESARRLRAALTGALRELGEER